MLAERVKQSQVGPKGYYQWISISEISEIEYHPAGIYVTIGEHCFAKILFGISGSIKGFSVFYDPNMTIPDEWFYKDWLYFFEELYNIGYKGGYIGRDKFFDPDNDKTLNCIRTFYIPNTQ